MYYTWWSKSSFFCFQQRSLNIKQKFEFLYHLIDGERLLSLLIGTAVSFSINKLTMK